MNEFTSFFTDILNAVADFLWLDSMRWIVGMVFLLGIATFIKKIIE